MNWVVMTMTAHLRNKSRKAPYLISDVHHWMALEIPKSGNVFEKATIRNNRIVPEELGCFQVLFKTITFENSEV